MDRVLKGYRHANTLGEGAFIFDTKALAKKWGRILQERGYSVRYLQSRTGNWHIYIKEK